MRSDPPNSQSSVHRLRSLLAQAQSSPSGEYFTESCPGCRNWVGNRAGGRLLVCAMHPFGQPNCADFESYDTIGADGYPPELDRDPLHKHQPKVKVRRGDRSWYGSLLHRQHHQSTGSSPEGWYYSVIVWDAQRRSNDIAWLHESDVTLL